MILKNRNDTWVADGKNDTSAKDLDAIFDSAFNEKAGSDLVSNDENSNTNQVTYQGKIANF